MIRVAALLVGLTACTPSITFPCTANGPCGTDGTCIAGFCAFPDPGCPSGQRYGELAPSGLADSCASPPDAAIPAEVMSFGDPVTVDAWIDSENPTRNHGTATLIRADHDPPRYGLLRFDVSAIPAGSTVASVDLHVWTATGFNDGGVIRLYVLKEAWDEGTASDAVGVVSWSQRQTGVDWTGPGATGLSREPQAVGEIPATADDREYVVTLSPSVVQAWVDDPGTNFGWVLVAEDAATDSANLVSSEGSPASKRPRLVVSYR